MASAPTWPSESGESPGPGSQPWLDAQWAGSDLLGDTLERLRRVSSVEVETLGEHGASTAFAASVVVAGRGAGP
ncbi:MAG: hypothetical protein MI919_22975 [Holophagales bacterium]|nr:hypothetical protein [Holophagales bacterium]